MTSKQINKVYQQKHGKYELKSPKESCFESIID